MTSSLLMSNTTGFWNKTGEAVRADGWYGNIDGLHTMSIYVSSLLGRVYLEGSLAEKPEDSDWFTIQIPGQDHEYIQYPRASSNEENGGETSVTAYNFTFNLTWVRLRLDRSYIAEPPLDQYADYGLVVKALLNS